MESAMIGRKCVLVCSTIRGLLPALRSAMPAVSFVEIPSEDLRRGAKATERWDRDGIRKCRNQGLYRVIIQLVTNLLLTS